jgi:hypothetical protein
MRQKFVLELGKTLAPRPVAVRAKQDCVSAKGDSVPAKEDFVSGVAVAAFQTFKV